MPQVHRPRSLRPAPVRPAGLPDTSPEVGNSPPVNEWVEEGHLPCCFITSVGGAPGATGHVVLGTRDVGTVRLVKIGDYGVCVKSTLSDLVDR